MSRYFILSVLFLSACTQYICYDGTYVEDPYDCFSHGGLSYFSAQSEKVPSLRSGVASKRAARTFSGIWNLSANASSNSCAGVPASISRRITITERRGVLTAAVPGTGRFNGRSGGSKARFAGKSRKVCTVNYDIGVSLISSSRAALQGTISAACLSLYSCSMNIRGTLSR